MTESARDEETAVRKHAKREAIRKAAVCERSELKSRPDLRRADGGTKEQNQGAIRSLSFIRF
jgi:hypothetical protein